MTQRFAFAAVTVAAVALTAACGSTVQLQGQVRSGEGLSASQPQSESTDSGGTTGGSAVTPTDTGSTSTAGTGSSVPTGSGQGSTGGSTGSTTSASGGATTATGPKSTAGPLGKSSAIQIGYVTTSVGNAEALGANPGNTYTDKAMFEALVEEYNKAGGVAGHKILPVFGATDTASSNWAQDFAAVCAKFTQDNKVKIVLGYVFVFQPDFESCLAKKGVPHLYGGYQPGDIGTQKEFPTIVATGHPNVDGFNLAALDGALRTGLLTKKTKLGMLVDTCANGARAFKSSTEPWLKSHGINYQAVQVDCARGASDVSAAASAVSSAELKFASSGVDLVYAFGIGLIVFMQQADSQGYHPKYVTTIAGAAVADNAPEGQVKNMHGFGWMPSVDVGLSQQPYAQTPAQKTCLAKLAKHGLKPAAYNDFMTAYQACDGLELYAKALTASSSTAAATVVQGVVNALPSFRGAGTYNGVLQSSAHQRGGPATMREYAWTTSCSCLTYRGPLLKVPTP